MAADEEGLGGAAAGRAGTVLGKLDHADILDVAGRVCRSWRRAAADEPALWHRIEARSRAGLAVARLAVRRSAGRCEEFRVEDAGYDGLLLYLAKQLPSLKSLHLISCHCIFNEGSIEAIKKFPLLEKLEISHCENIFGEAIEAVGQACPHLKHFRLSKHDWGVSNKDQDA